MSILSISTSEAVQSLKAHGFSLNSMDSDSSFQAVYSSRQGGQYAKSFMIGYAKDCSQVFLDDVNRAIRYAESRS